MIEPTASRPRYSSTRSFTMLRPVAVEIGLIFLPALYRPWQTAAVNAGFAAAAIQHRPCLRVFGHCLRSGREADHSLLVALADDVA